MKKMSKGMLMTALICGAVYMGTTPVYANDVQEFTLDEYVVTAARTETKLVDTPANISVVDAKTIEERHYQDVSEVLKDVPGTNVIDSGVGAYEKTIKLNGDDRVLILVDGRRVNTDMGTMNARSSYDFNQMPSVEMIERVEVLKGAGGALYGSDAVGGVINIITKKADRNFGKVSIGYGSMGAKDYSAMYSIKEGKTGVSVAASKNEQDYYKYRDTKSNTTKRWPGESNFKNEKVSLNVEQELSNDVILKVGYDYSKFEGWNPYSLSSPTSYHSYIDKKTENLFAKLDWTIKNVDSGYMQIYRNEYEYFNVSGMQETTTGLDVQQEITTGKNNKVIIGSSWRKSKADNEIAFNDKEIENLAIFVNDVWEFTPSWTLNIGARYDDHSEAGNDTTMSAGLNKKVDDNSHIYFNWTQVFKAPTIDDLYYFSDAWGWISKGDPNLKPETGDTWTLGYSKKINQNTDIGINYFESNLDDAIDWNTVSGPDNDGDGWADSGTTSPENVSKQEKKGMELTLSHKLNDNVDLIASYTYINVKNNRNDGNGYVKDWNYVPNTYRFGVNYHDGKWNANAWLRAGSGASTYNNGYKQAYVDSNYLTVDLSVTYKATKDLSLYAKGYNIFNESYAETAGVNYLGTYDYPAQSRRFIVGAEYKF